MASSFFSLKKYGNIRKLGYTVCTLFSIQKSLTQLFSKELNAHQHAISLSLSLWLEIGLQQVVKEKKNRQNLKLQLFSLSFLHFCICRENGNHIAHSTVENAFDQMQSVKYVSFKHSSNI